MPATIESVERNERMFWNMTNEMMNRRNDMLNAFDDWFGFPKDFFDASTKNIMQSDVAENDKNYTVKVDMPGMDKKDITINYANNMLTINGTRKSVKDDNDKKRNIIHQERSEGAVSRSYSFPNVDSEKITAKYDNGVLTVILPKQTNDKSSSIKID